MCEQCLVNPLYYGEVLKGWFLIRARRDGNNMLTGEWGLVQLNDPTVYWKTSPTMIPTFEMTDEEEEAYEASHPEYMFVGLHDRLGDFLDVLDLDPYTGYELVKAAIDAGYVREVHGYFQDWLFNYLGKWIIEHEPEVDHDCFPKLNETNPHDYTLGLNYSI